MGKIVYQSLCKCIVIEKIMHRECVKSMLKYISDCNLESLEWRVKFVTMWYVAICISEYSHTRAIPQRIKILDIGEK